MNKESKASQRCLPTLDDLTAWAAKLRESAAKGNQLAKTAIDAAQRANTPGGLVMFIDALDDWRFHQRVNKEG